MTLIIAKSHLNLFAILIGADINHPRQQLLYFLSNWPPLVSEDSYFQSQSDHVQWEGAEPGSAACSLGFS